MCPILGLEVSQAEDSYLSSEMGNVFFENGNFFSLITPDVGTPPDLSIKSLNICFVLCSHSVHFQFNLLAR